MGYLETLLEEKGISVETSIDIDGHFGLTVQNVVEFVSSLDANTKKKIKDNFVKIDFLNGDIMHFINYIANGMVQYA